MRAVSLKTPVRWASVLGIFCVALVLMSGVVQAAHFHAGGQTDHDCALCLTAHQIAHAAAPVTVPLDSHAVAAVAIPRTLHRPRRAIAFSLVSRPPPSLALSLS